MSETFLTSTDSTELVPAEEIVERIETPVAQLAYEGLMKIVNTGQMLKEDAIRQHRTIFPDKPINQRGL